MREELKVTNASCSPYKIIITPPLSSQVIHFKDLRSCSHFVPPTDSTLFAKQLIKIMITSALPHLIFTELDPHTWMQESHKLKLRNIFSSFIPLVIDATGSLMVNTSGRDAKFIRMCVHAS